MGLEKSEDPETNCQHSLDHRESEGIPSHCFIDYTKPFDCVDHNKLWKALKKMGIPDHLTCLLRNLYLGQETEPCIEQQIGSRLRKEYDRAVCCHPDFLTYMLSTS